MLDECLTGGRVGMFKRLLEELKMQQEPEGMHCEWTVYTKQLKQVWWKYLGHCGTSRSSPHALLSIIQADCIV